MTRSILRQPTAIAPIFMSAVALAVIAAQILVAGTAPQRDEGTAAHLWQLFMAAQIPVIAIFAATSFPRAARQTAIVLAIQLAAALAAAAPVFFLRW
jgi:cytochrome bd-type quinol oxidase subunit 2